MLSLDSSRSSMYNRHWLFQMLFLILTSFPATLLGTALCSANSQQDINRTVWKICSGVCRGYAGMLSFDSSRSTMYNRDWLFQMPFLILTSLAAGLLGATFNLLRRGLWRVRASRTRPGLRLLEASFSLESCLGGLG